MVQHNIFNFDNHMNCTFLITNFCDSLAIDDTPPFIVRIFTDSSAEGGAPAPLLDRGIYF